MNEEELIQETRRLIGRWDNVQITGLGWSGDPRRGFQFNPTDVRTGGGGSGGTPPSPTTSGACCPTEGDCFITTQAICEAGGGTYQGDNTTCDPDPCPPKGACCVGTNCTIETETDCTGMGGTYQGDDTVCDPNPCTSCCCFSGFNFVHTYNTQKVTWTVHMACDLGDGCLYTADGECQTTQTCVMDGEDCVVSDITCEVLEAGTSSRTAECGSPACSESFDACILSTLTNFSFTPYGCAGGEIINLVITVIDDATERWDFQTFCGNVDGSALFELSNMC